ncbi:MAG: hypothetical protein HZB53_07040 [Chloroflexi bacterium]|nr:hypothetical protein [Chloroflexota bacterium]
MNRSPVRRHAAVLGGYLALALLLTWPTAANFASAIPGDGFDGLQNYWNLWWVRRALLDLQTSPFFTTELFYPTGASLLFHTLNILNGLWALPVQLLGGLVVAYNTVVIATFVLCGYGAYLLARDTLRRASIDSAALDRAAFLAGFIFAFAPVRMAHLLGHMQVLSSEWLPFFALAFLRMERRPEPLGRRAILPALFLALNALCDWYFALYALIFAGLVVAWRWGVLWRTHYRTLRRYLSPLLDAAATVGLFALLLSPLLAPMLREASTASYLRPPFDETIMLSADLLAFVTPSEFHPLWGEAARTIADQFTSSASERTVFAGYTVLALAALGIWRLRSRRVAFWLAAAVAFFLLALGPVLHILGVVPVDLPLPYAWLYALVPLVRITRSVSRYDIMLMLALGQLAAAGFVAVPALARRGGFALALGLIAFEFLAAPYPQWPIETPAFYAQIAQEQGAFALLELPINWDRPDPLVYQTVHARPLITAYTSRANPLSIAEKMPVLNRLRTLEPDILVYDARAIGLSVLSDLGVRYVINHPLTMGEGDERTVTNQTLRDLFGARTPLVNEPNLAVYRVEPPSPHQPYVALGDGWGDVTQAAGKPQRIVSERATLRVAMRDPQPRTVRLTLRAQAQAAQVRISGGAAPLTATVDPEAVMLDAPVTAAGEIVIETDAPVVVTAIEMRWS